MKKQWKAGTLLYPVPAVMVSCGADEAEHNIITISWIGTINSDPPMLSISIRKSRHSYDIIRRNMDFVVNLASKELAHATDWCGVRSGKDFDKFKEMKLTPEKAQLVKAPLIAESPLNLECKVKQIIPLGSHDLFIAEIVMVNYDDSLMDDESGKFNLDKAQLIMYSHGMYYQLGNQVGKFGFSVEKKKRWRNDKARKK